MNAGYYSTIHQHVVALQFVRSRWWRKLYHTFRHHYTNAFIHDSIVITHQQTKVEMSRTSVGEDHPTKGLRPSMSFSPHCGHAQTVTGYSTPLADHFEFTLHTLAAHGMRDPVYEAVIRCRLETSDEPAQRRRGVQSADRIHDMFSRPLATCLRLQVCFECHLCAQSGLHCQGLAGRSWQIDILFFATGDRCLMAGLAGRFSWYGTWRVMDWELMDELYKWWSTTRDKCSSCSSATCIWVAPIYHSHLAFGDRSKLPGPVWGGSWCLCQKLRFFFALGNVEFLEFVFQKFPFDNAWNLFASGLALRFTCNIIILNYINRGTFGR